MDARLEKKVDLMAQNYLTVRNSGKLDMNQAMCLGALIFTQSDAVADEEKIRACRKILKGKVGMFSNFRGYTNLALLCKMALHDNPGAYLDGLITAYEALTANKTFCSESLVFAAEAMSEGVDEDRYAQVSKEAWDTIAKMKFTHPLLTSQSDAAIATLLVMSGMDVDGLLSKADAIYDRMKDSGFKFNKDALQSISLILALSDKPLEEKVQRFTNLRNALKKAGHGLGTEEMVVLAAFVDVDAPIATIVEEISAADDALKTKKGFGSFFGCGTGLRRLFAAALVLQIHEEDKASVALSQANALTSIVVEQVITLIILLVVIISVSATVGSH